MSLEDDGFEILPNFISNDIAEDICKELRCSIPNQHKGGIRSIDKKVQSIHNLAHSRHLIDTASRYLDGSVSLVRALLFNKSPETNWLVSWHQDKTVALNKYDPSIEWTPWSIKDSLHHASPTQEVLEKIITIRIHLDDNNIENGCLKVIPKTHLKGILSEKTISEISKHHSETFIEAPRLSALLMKPLLLHASSKAVNPNQRRILHLEYSSFKLPNDLSWG